MPSGSGEARERPIREDLVRALVLEAYDAIRGEGRVADRTLDGLLRRERRLWSRERRAVAETVYDLLRSELRLAWILERSLGERWEGLSRHARHALLLAAHDVSGGQDPGRALQVAGLAPALLGGLEACAAPEALLERIDDPILRLAVDAALPEWIARLFVEEWGLDEARKLAEALNERAPLTLRANLLRGDRDGLAARLAQEGVSTLPGRWSPWALHAEGRQNLFHTRSFRGGYFEVQDEGSQLLAKLVAPRPGELVVDACAGAGGKTLALAAMMEDRGRIIALDADARRLGQIGARTRRAGVHNWESHVVPQEGSAAIEARTRGKADAVLVDAPCTGLGVLRRNPDARFRLQEGAPHTFAALQKRLLARYAQLAKPGGRIVYATCSVSRKENEEVVAAVLAAHPELEAVDARDLLGADAREELLDGGNLRLFPHRHGTDGFFAAVLRRKGDG